MKQNFSSEQAIIFEFLKIARCYIRKNNEELRYIIPFITIMIGESIDRLKNKGFIKINNVNLKMFIECRHFFSHRMSNKDIIFAKIIHSPSQFVEFPEFIQAKHLIESNFFEDLFNNNFKFGNTLKSHKYMYSNLLEYLLELSNVKLNEVEQKAFTNGGDYVLRFSKLIKIVYLIIIIGQLLEDIVRWSHLTYIYDSSKPIDEKKFKEKLANGIIYIPWILCDRIDKDLIFLFIEARNDIVHFERIHKSEEEDSEKRYIAEYNNRKNPDNRIYRFGFIDDTSLLIYLYVNSVKFRNNLLWCYDNIFKEM